MINLCTSQMYTRIPFNEVEEEVTETTKQTVKTPTSLVVLYISKLFQNDISKIAIISNSKILETRTSNLLFVKDKKFFTPKKDYYEGNTYKFFKTKIKKIIKKDILVNELKKYDEIILIGSGKGVTSVKTIKQIGWKRKNLIQYKIFSKYYLSAIKKCNLYKFK